MQKSNKVLKLVVLSMLVAVGVVISPLLRVEGMCPMAHFINIVCSAFLGPWYSLACAVTIGIIRMALMGIPPIALTGAIFGAFLSGIFYRMSKGNLLLAVLGEVIGTGIIGAIASYPVMSFFWNKEGLTLLFYVPSFICGTLIGGSIAFAFLKKLAGTGMLEKFQTMLGTERYTYTSSIFGNALTIAAFGVIGYVIVQILKDMFSLTSPVWPWVSYALIVVFAAFALTYWIYKSVRSRQYDSRICK
ncbi:MAG: energy coupling factor transporter S component ThiW [Ruminococcaceae bacterium]|nr:energy coupling factor transporter S component ThiW [Oscillospiraceae bacterium]